MTPTWISIINEFMRNIVMRPLLLIALNDSGLCDTYQHFLGKQGYEVESTCDGLECLARLRRQSPAVIILDRHLLWGGGDGILAWLREECGAAKIPVILMVDGMVDKPLPPVKQVLRKPFPLSELLETVRSAALPVVQSLQCQPCS
jgi:DNA-binding response OmpR family regulator